MKRMKKKFLLPLCVGTLLVGCGGQPEPEKLTYWDNIAEVASWKDVDAKINATVELTGPLTIASETEIANAKAIIDGNFQLDKETMTGKMDLSLGFPEEVRTAFAENSNLSHITLPESIDLNMYITPDSILIPKNLYSMATTVFLGLPINADMIPFDYVSIDLDAAGIDFHLPTTVAITEEVKEKCSSLQEELGLDIVASDEGNTFNINLDKAKFTDLIVKFGQSFKTQEEFENFLNAIELEYSSEEVPSMYAVLQDEATIRSTFEETINTMGIDYTATFEPEQYMVDSAFQLSDLETEMKANVNIVSKKSELDQIAPEEGAVIMSMEEATAALMSAFMSQGGL
ncbi:hypothetical protein AN640_04090 [Candidatus Epulonipiscium fishelsonii]|uniref:Uncharacterized protein n=1 Tax=Candidatus Epulonipiscium fishelsonii TaxID=77094 RepID=A0ACC8XIZ2_9FIRM|nr:hypothetical protein AN640_04090 [Epulopiscium sp. SCG-D08WGA-EpuloA1]OON93791.1 MAG: hypothetical protein ATN32_01635 [Epulopiscium sp. AS2M-Bin002]